ncbi:hypothetical protein [Nocardia cyriacigeorgica]|uniref:hypothetical protein n=1 Tax=Nocardia cyriacigeorgica TaxID=135487 RepID=UPI002456DA2D|nr:hypothetical protein [Nocardia cyriacigeorgica]
MSEPPGRWTWIYTGRVYVRRLIAASFFATLTTFGAVACTVQGDGYTSECKVEGCLITFERGVDAEASVLGLKIKVVKVEGNTVSLSVGGQEVTVPVGESGSLDGNTISVREVTDDKVVINVSSGLRPGS